MSLPTISDSMASHNAPPQRTARTGHRRHRQHPTISQPVCSRKVLWIRRKPDYTISDPRKTITARQSQRICVLKPLSDTLSPSNVITHMKPFLIALCLLSAPLQAQSQLKPVYDGMSDTSTFTGHYQTMAPISNRDFHVVFFTGTAQGKVEFVESIQLNYHHQSPVKTAVDAAPTPSTPVTNAILILLDDSVRVRLTPTTTNMKRTYNALTGTWDEERTVYALTTDQVHQLAAGHTFKFRVNDQTWNGVPGTKEMQNLTELCARMPSCATP